MSEPSENPREKWKAQHRMERMAKRHEESADASAALSPRRANESILAVLLVAAVLVAVAFLFVKWVFGLSVQATMLAVGWILSLVGWVLAMFVGLWINVSPAGQPPIVARHGRMIGLAGLMLLVGGPVLAYLIGYTLSTVAASVAIAWIAARGFTAYQRRARIEYEMKFGRFSQKK